MTTTVEQHPLFTVVIPVFNRITELSRALTSVIMQTEQDFEVIVVDDGSDANYAAEIQKLVDKKSDDRIRLIQYPNNRNGAFARNIGIKYAHGQYICFLDSDDEWHEQKLTHIRTAVNNNKNASILYHQYQNIQNGKRATPFPPIGIAASQSVADYSFCQNHGGGIQSSCLTVEKKLAQQVLFNERLKGHQDWDFLLRLGAETQSITFIAQSLTLRHISSDHGNMVSHSLPYEFSLEFLQDYSRYFSWRAKAAYATFVLEARRQKCFPPAEFTHYQLLAWLYYPRHCLMERRKKYALDMRCQHLVNHCREHKIKSVCLVGYNDYTRILLGKHENDIKVTLVIDRHKRLSLENGLTVRNFSDVSQAKWDKVDLVVTVTDNHHESMRNDLIEIKNLFFLEF